MKKKKDMKESFDEGERIGVIGSPSSTSGILTDVLGTAINKKLVGNLSIFRYMQEGKPHYSLGQITEIHMSNIWTEDPTVRGIIKQKGRVDPLTERHDVHNAKMMIGATFGQSPTGFEQSSLGTVPSTGTGVKLVTEDMLGSLLSQYSPEIFYLGRIYGTDIRMPMWLRHFGDSPGVGEAYHIGIFGKTGSGKSYLAKMAMIGYARHKEMSIFVLDPQGEFSKIMNDERVSELLTKRLGREVEVYGMKDLVLDGYPAFKKVLDESPFLKNLTIIEAENKDQATYEIIECLKGKGKAAIRTQTLESYSRQQQTRMTKKEIPPWHAHKRDIFEKVWERLGDENVQGKIFRSPNTKARLAQAYARQDPDIMYEEWVKVANLFKYGGNRKGVGKLIEQIGREEGSIIIVDLSEDKVPDNVLWDESIRSLVLGQLLEKISSRAEGFYKDGKLLNCLVIIDEAHRLAPRLTPEEKTADPNLAQVKATLLDAVRTTRKYGLGWMFISQTLSSLDREIIGQIRIYVFGFGLAWGRERQSLREIIGGLQESIRLYQGFKDPQSAIGEKEYPFMAVGPISPLSFSETPLFFTALKYPDEFLTTNFASEPLD